MSNTDLYGRPLTPAAEFQLSKWQRRQATLLYHFASLDYLKGLKKLLDDFVNGVDVTLDLAKQQGRDQLIAGSRWGVRDTSANFGTYGFPALKDFQKSVSRQMSEIASEYYHATGYIQCSRLLGELSLGWSTPEEQARFEAGMEAIGRYAGWIDTTMQHQWDDYIAALAWDEFKGALSPLPNFRVRIDVVGESGRRPVRTGVYVSQDDPYGTLQFAWTGNSDGRLFPCSTFNELGLQAVGAVGRDALWTDDKRLLTIATQPRHLSQFKELDWFQEPDFLKNPEKAKQFIGGAAFLQRPCKWYYVERVEGEYEDESQADATSAHAEQTRGRCEAGQPCPHEGFWFSPAQTSSRRYFKSGEVMPELGGDYGATIWQWDQNQGRPTP